MAAGRCLLLLAACAALGGAFRQDPSADRPSLKEWKEGKANASAAEAASAARSAKMAAVEKVSTLLQDLFAKVSEDAEKESGTFNKTMLFCEDTTTEKNAAITAGMDRQAALTTKIEELTTKLGELETTISGLLGDIETAEEEKKEAVSKRNKALKIFEKNSADLMGAIHSLEGALRTLKASKEEPALVQLQSVSKTVQRAAFLADALGLGKADQMAFLQQAPEVQMENYKYHSDKIISMLEKLMEDFRAAKADVDAEEVKSVAAHDALMQEKETLLKQKNIELDEARKDQAEANDNKASAKQQLTVTEGDLDADREYLDKLTAMCSDLRKTYKQRSAARQDELTALSTAIDIVSESVSGNTSAKTVRLLQASSGSRLAEIMAHNPAALQAAEDEAEDVDAGAAPSFIQEVSKKALRGAQPENEAQEVVAQLLRSSGEKIKSTLLTSLASKLSGDPLGKVKQLIEDLITKLLNEASAEQSQKGFCDKSTADAKQKRQLAAQAIEKLNGEMMELEARRDELTEDIATLTQAIADLTEEVNKAEELRKEENRENEATVVEAQAGLKATQQAMQVLERYYKTVDDAKVDLSAEALLQQSPMEDAPSAGFKIGEAYQGSQGESSGILGMLEVIASDFKRTVKTTLAEEERARQEHVAFSTQTGASLAEKNAAVEHKSGFKDSTLQELATAVSDLDAQSNKLQSSIRELLDLKPVCVDTGMSYEERVAMREAEIESLKKALCILDSYAEYGPGKAGSC